MPMSPNEQRRRAIETRWARVTDPDQRRAATRPARISSAVRTIVDSWPELSPEQVQKIRALLSGGEHDAT